MKCVLQLLVATVVTVTLIVPTSANAGVIAPQRGGSSIGGTVAPMIMPYITIVGTEIRLMGNVAPANQPLNLVPWATFTGYSTPIMRPLDSTKNEELSTTVMPIVSVNAYNALDGKAWNWQYGWASAAFTASSIPSDANIWIEVLEQSPGLKTYDRTGTNDYVPIFGTPGSPNGNKWKWPNNLTMAHNAYTVDPSFANWSAKYRVYVGYTNSVGHANGDTVPGYTDQEVILNWTSIPEPATLGLLGTGLFFLLRKKAKA